ncbi:MULTISPECIES: hypothetical protein [unclassified Nocardiopsis]|uniref:hypothetical protein n=1 Tax=Nocardiopsis TaxID=2013 RepID=UPI00387A9011
MRVKPRLLLIAAMAAAFFGAAPALASDDAPGGGDAPVAAPSDSAKPNPEGTPEPDEVPRDENGDPMLPTEEELAELEREREEAGYADPALPIPENPNYTG